MKVRIKDIAEVINGSTPSTQNPEYYDGDIIWITPKDLSDQNSKYIYSGERSITQAGYNSCSTKMIPENNILMSSRAPIGLLAINKVECCTNQGFKSLIVDKTKCNVEYLYYYLKYHIKEIESLGSGTTFKEVSKDSMEKYEIVLPSIKVQETISNVLSLLDNKIINNNKINDELESMAKTLYNYWFLQFEFPNENGKPYKSSGGKMIWSEELKREIPEGWEAIKLKNIVKKTNRVYDYNKESKTYDLSIMPSNSISINDTSSSKDFETNLFAVKEGDILFGSIRPYLRKAGIASYDGAVAGTIHCYEVIKESNYNLALFTLTSENMFKYAINNSKGTKMPVITSDDLLEFMLPYNEEIAKKFNNIKIREIIIANIKQSNELASLRDFLLPLLMNGQVKFKDN